jgi:hypothetical protein
MSEEFIERGMGLYPDDTCESRLSVNSDRA